MVTKSRGRAKTTDVAENGSANVNPVPGRTEAPFADDMSFAPDMPFANDMPFAPTASAAPAERSSALLAPIVRRNGREVTGEDVLALARRHIGEVYKLGARAPMANAGWKGPWDCAEFVSWCVFQSSGILFGTQPRNDPVRADAFTGFWARQARAAGCTVRVAEAAVIPGAVLLRFPQPGAVGHIVFCDGSGGTVEAHSSKTGVIAHTISARRWDTGVLVPGVRYFRAGDPVRVTAPSGVFRLTEPMTKSDMVEKIQRRLVKLGFAPGTADGIYGPQTADAVKHFQADRGLVVDGEVGPDTLAALGLP